MKNIIKVLILTILLMVFSVKSKALTLSTEGDGDILVTEEELDNGYSYEEKHTEVTNINNIEIKDSFISGVDEFCLCGRISGSGLMYYPYLAYYKNNELAFELNFSSYGRGIFNDLIVNDEGIIAIGNYEENDVCVIAIFEVSFDGRIKKHVKFYSDKDSYGYKILELKNEYMFIGSTYASTFEGCVNVGTKSLVVGRIDKDDFSDNYVVSFGNDSMDFHDAVSDGESIFILTTVNGLGYFYDGSRTKFLALLKMDHYCDSPEYVSLYGSEVVKTSKMFIYQEHVCFMEIERSHQVGLVSYTKNLDYLNMDIYTDYHLPSNINDFNVEVNGDDFILSLTSKYNNKLYERRIIFNSEFDEISNNEYIHRIDDVIKGFRFNNNVFLVILKNTTYEIYTSFDVIKKGDYVLINGKKAQITKEGEDTNDFFGKKKEYYEAELGDIKVRFSKEIEVELKTNIVPFSTYDKGINLSFNAKGYLNGVEIESGYQVNDAGQYLLELVSLDGKRESIYFTVGKLTIDLDEVKVIDSSASAIEVGKIIETYYDKEQKVSTSESLVVIEKNYNYVYLGLAGVMGLIIGYFLIRIKKGAKKRWWNYYY